MAIAPQPSTTGFSSWWYRAVKEVPKESRKGVNSLIILVGWEIWKHRNNCIFNGESPDVGVSLQVIANECMLWCAAGAKGLQGVLERAFQGG